MDCVICQCHFGKIECSRLKCRKKRELLCENPVKVTGHCCPVCQNKEQHFSPDSFNPLEDIKTQKRCLSTRSNFIVWKSSSVGISSEVTQV
ncbi:UNVERIFIED_CONTAM: hypothetical protein RMT77_007703 [Armadillidium vulgare]